MRRRAGRLLWGTMLSVIVYFLSYCALATHPVLDETRPAGSPPATVPGFRTLASVCSLVYRPAVAIDRALRPDRWSACNAIYFDVYNITDLTNFVRDSPGPIDHPPIYPPAQIESELRAAVELLAPESIEAVRGQVLVYARPSTHRDVVSQISSLRDRLP